ncbi:MAG: ferrous iron transport protein B [Polyangia bacterium]|jgi:ferrous iron transport protein B
MFAPLDASAQTADRQIRVALAGNPNCGKTSLFNALTGAHQHVANYAGVTVERRSGSCSLGDGLLEIVDLPGTYSLSSYSPEERVAQDELTAAPDVVVVVVDSTQLHRHLVLLAQLMQTGSRLVLCLNMADEARASGQKLDLELMERLLGLPVVETVGHRGQGIAELKAAIARVSARPAAPSRLVLGSTMDEALAAIRPLLPASGGRVFASDWMAARLLLGDRHYASRVLAMPGGAAALAQARRQRERIEARTGQDIVVFTSGCYYGFAQGLLREVCIQPSRADARQVTDRVDAVLVHRWLGLPIFALVMYAIFWLTFKVGEIPMEWIDGGVRKLGGLLGGLWPVGSPSLLRSLLIDGVLGGVGGVIVFLPNIVLLFLGLAFLEDTGYMARAAFLTDRLMHRFGLHGKSFLPMLSGFGCSIPGIMATRTLESQRDRLITMLVLPLISCGARLTIWMLLIPAFFPPAWRAPMLWFIYAFGIGLALLLALLLRKTLMRGDDTPFVMELPPYRLPTLRSVPIRMMERSGLYLRKAGTTILGMSVLLWAATSFPHPSHFRVDGAGAAPPTAELARAPLALPHAEEAHLAPDLTARRAAESLEYSIAGRIGHRLEFVFRPLGFDWKIVTAMIGAFAAKEIFVAQMGIVCSLADADKGSEGLRRVLAREYRPAVGLSLMLFMLVASPCMATVAVTRRESGKWSYALLQLGGLTGLGYVLALLAFQIGKLVM